MEVPPGLDSLITREYLDFKRLRYVSAEDFETAEVKEDLESKWIRLEDRVCVAGTTDYSRHCITTGFFSPLRQTIITLDELATHLSVVDKDLAPLEPICGRQ
jgi:hypothetical protein